MAILIKSGKPLLAKDTTLGSEYRHHKASASTPILVMIYPWETKHARLLHNILPNTHISVYNKHDLPSLSTVAYRYGQIITTRKDVLEAIAPRTEVTSAKDFSVYTFAGSNIPYGGSQWLILEPLSRLPYDMAYNVLMRQYCRKFTEPEHFPALPFTPYVYHKGGNEVSTSHLVNLAKASTMMSMDVETMPFVTDPDGEVLMHNVLTVVGFAFLVGDEVQSHSIAVDSTHALSAIRAVCATPTPKVTHGGKYDAAWCYRWGIPMENHTHDTMHEFHSWYHDFRKSLAKVSAFCNIDYVYWKEERKAVTLHDKLIYNAKDVHNTLLAMLYMGAHAPDWTKVATHRKIRRMHINTASSILGMNTSEVLLAPAKAEQQAIIDEKLSALQTLVGSDDFNPNSPPQNQLLLKVLAVGSRLKVTGSDKKQMEKVAATSPFAQYWVAQLTEYKASLKIMNSYLMARKWGGRIHTSIDVCGTTSDRLASRTSDFWHYPDRGKSGKFLKPKSYGWASMTVKAVARKHIIADEGMKLFSCDLPSAEAYFVWKLSGDPVLGDVLKSDNDYHATNAHLFFGVPYEDIYDNMLRKVLNKPLRDLSKRINHGSNYNMGPATLIETMGIKKVLEAQVLLGLDPRMSATQVAGYLLTLFMNTYQHIKGGDRVMRADSWYGSLCKEVKVSGRIVTPDGWNKYIFGNPIKDKMVMNNLASVKPQHLSAEYLHQGYDTLWREHYKHGVFEPLLPIHDEAVGQCLASYEDYYSPIIQEALTLDFPMGEGADNILRIKPDAPIFGYTWYDVH